MNEYEKLLKQAEDGIYNSLGIPKEKLNSEKEDKVNHPSHYTDGKIECIEAIEEVTKDLEGYEGYLTGNIVKYMWRWQKKNGVEDIKKAEWYIKRLIQYKEDE